jgi:hypothetical protein
LTTAASRAFCLGKNKTFETFFAAYMAKGKTPLRWLQTTIERQSPM